MITDAKTFLKTTPKLPGVYQMYDAQGKVIYVGKARNLKKRLSSYFQKRVHDIKTTALLAQVAEVKTIVTATEDEALILENQWIKQYHPRYNISFRDDKSFPYIFISADPFPCIAIHRGAKKSKGYYFGPYPDSWMAKQNLRLIQKVFKLHMCNEGCFGRRKNEPCLQYQLKLCSGACAGLISKDDYAKDVEMAKWFLEGHHEKVVAALTDRMNQAAQNLRYEWAALYRDQLQSLDTAHTQLPALRGGGSLDVIALKEKDHTTALFMMLIRHGQIVGHKSFFVSKDQTGSPAEIISSFLGQYYLQTEEATPQEILVNVLPTDNAVLKKVLSKDALHPVVLKRDVRGIRRKWLEMASVNAEKALEAHLLKDAHHQKRWELLQKILGLEKMARIECFDISHTFGESPVASCVVFGQEGPIKSEYRRFNIKTIIPGDDVGAFREVLARRYQHQKHHPDIIIVDGGKPQLNQAITSLAPYFPTDSFPLLMGIAKGPERKPGKETLFLSNREEPLILEPTSEAFHLLQFIRDEAHRFAITGHRQKRKSARAHSVLESIPGIGKNRRKILLTHFGGLHGILSASLENLKDVPGISDKVAENLYRYLKDMHQSGNG